MKHEDLRLPFFARDDLVRDGFVFRRKVPSDAMLKVHSHLAINGINQKGVFAEIENVGLKEKTVFCDSQHASWIHQIEIIDEALGRINDTSDFAGA